jgi:hypothetical protein
MKREKWATRKGKDRGMPTIVSQLSPLLEIPDDRAWWERNWRRWRWRTLGRKTGEPTGDHANDRRGGRQVQRLYIFEGEIGVHLRTSASGCPGRQATSSFQNENLKK